MLAAREMIQVVLSNYISRAILRSLPEGSFNRCRFVPKESVCDAGVLERVIEETGRGSVVAGAHLFKEAVSCNPALQELSNRECMVLDLMAEDLSNMSVAHQLGLTEKTVENYTHRIYQKLRIDGTDPHVQPRVRAVLAYLQANSPAPRSVR